jgi:N-acetylglucosaminyl-diphospho-decaprenol L-rhamnosyltransferase
VSSSDTVSVVIVTCNSLPSALTCLERLNACDSDIAKQIIVVDNASIDGTSDAIRQAYPGVTIVANQENLGFAHACNQGAEAATGDYLLLLNPDLEIDPEAISCLVAVVRSTRKAGLVAGRLRYPDGAFQANCRNFPTVTNLLFSRGSVMGRLLLSRLSLHTGFYTLPDYDCVTEVPAVAATMALIKRDLFRRMRGFDARFFLYMEDTDLSLRLHYAGYVNLFVPEAGGVHGFGQGSRIGRLKRNCYHHQSVWKYFLKHFPNGFSLILLPVLLTFNLILSAVIPTRRR